MEERIRILYAEDDPVIAELNRDMLEREGYVVDVVYNGEDAWEKYRQTTYHLLLLDIIMPGKSGFELLQAIRAEDTAMPVVIYSSVSGSEAVAKALDMGADEYIRKECEPPEILARLKVIVRHIQGVSAYMLSEMTRFCYSGYLLTVNGTTTVECPVCGIEGKISIDGDKLHVEFSEAQQARARGTFAGLREHTTEIQGFGAICGPKIMANKELLDKQMDRIKNFDKYMNE